MQLKWTQESKQIQVSRKYSTFFKKIKFEPTFAQKVSQKMVCSSPKWLWMCIYTCAETLCTQLKSLLSNMCVFGVDWKVNCLKLVLFSLSKFLHAPPHWQWFPQPSRASYDGGRSHILWRFLTVGGAWSRCWEELKRFKQKLVARFWSCTATCFSRTGETQPGNRDMFPSHEYTLAVALSVC